MAGFRQRSAKRYRAAVTYAMLTAFVLGYAAAWLFFNLGRMPPYIPGASFDPTYAPPRAVTGLAVVASALVLPGSVLACALAFRRRGRMLGRMRGSRALFLVLVLTGGCAVPREHLVDQGTRRGGLDAESSAQLDSLVRDVCGKTVVLLGEEPHHGGGHTLEIKSELAQRLIERCGFNAIYFESGIYEFTDLDRRLAAGTSAPEQVADAIGGLWSFSSAIDPLAGYLYTKASAGKIRLAGLDPQLGSATSGYEKAALVDDLMQWLNEPRRSMCAEVIARRTNGRYDTEHPDDAAERDRLVGCLGEGGDAAPPDSVFSVLARAAEAILMNPPGGGPGWETRERQMAHLFRWHQRRSPGASRAIVWTANVHAARYSEGVNGPVRPFGDELKAEYGDRLASIAFTALGGAYGRRDSTPIAAGPDSLEARALAGGAKPLRYLPKAALADLGVVDALVLSYAKARHADWSLLFDGAVVLREEKPLHQDRPPSPRFVPVGKERRGSATEGRRGSRPCCECASTDGKLASRLMLARTSTSRASA